MIKRYVGLNRFDIAVSEYFLYLVASIFVLCSNFSLPLTSGRSNAGKFENFEKKANHFASLVIGKLKFELRT